MSDLIRDSFTQFHQSIAASYQALNDHRIKIEDRKAQMLQLLETGITVPEPPSGSGEYQALCRDMMNDAKVQLQEWQNFIKGQIERSEFVNRHQKSILSLVFADVNAGKSSLGNFVGGWNLRDTEYANLYTPYICEIEDFSKASKENRQIRTTDHFEEGATEATSTIQHYTLKQGLTWVDTPGLHSLTTEHGDLAKEYIQFADLVVYLTPSSSPFKADERKMLGELFRMGKPVILAITKSDIVDEDEDADGNVVYRRGPKSAQNRQAQEEYVTQQAREINGNKNLENSHVLSLSVMLARDAVKQQDAQLYEASNLPQFLSQMGGILSAKAIELKMRRPKTEINTFIDRLIGIVKVEDDSFETIIQERSDLAQRQENLKKVLAECREAEPRICADIEQMFPVSLSRLFRSLRDRKSLNDSETVRREASDNISALVAEECKRHLLEKLGSVSIALPQLEVVTIAGEGYQVQSKEKIVVRRIERDPKGLWENVVHFFDKDTKFYDTVNGVEDIPVGDNFSTFLDAQVESLRPEVRKHVSTIIDRMASSCIDPLLACYQQLDRQLEQLTSKLEALRFTEE